MAWAFGDSFDCYAAVADLANGYWDSTTAVPTLTTGRFSGSQALAALNTGIYVTKSSGQNDGVHHLVCAYYQSAAITGSTLGLYLQLLDGTTGQCCIVFRSDGAVLLTSGTPGGTVLATYSGAFPVINTWYAFEVEILISNTAGYVNIRKNGNNVNDFTSATNLDTQNSANAYANKLQVGLNSALGSRIDDLYWRSDASSVAWMGDIRCYTRAPASDASVQFSRLPSLSATIAQGATAAINTSSAKFSKTITAPCDGTIGTVALSLQTGLTGNMKCSIYASVANAPAAVLASATVLANPVNGTNTFTFPSPLSVTKGQTIIVAFISDTASGTYNFAAGSTGFAQSGTSYAAFPTPSPSISAAGSPVYTVFFSLTQNYPMVSEAQQDATTSYVYDSVPGHADLYGIAAIASTPLTTYAVTTRAYMIKSDAGTRTAAVQLRSGGTTDASPTIVLTPSNWQWAWKHYTSDPAGGAWTAAAVNVAQVGPVVIA